MTITAAVQCVCARCLFLRREDLGSHEDLLHQLRQDVEEMSQVQVHIFVLFQFRRVQLETQEGKTLVQHACVCRVVLLNSKAKGYAPTFFLDVYKGKLVRILLS